MYLLKDKDLHLGLYHHGISSFVPVEKSLTKGEVDILLIEILIIKPLFLISDLVHQVF